MTFENRLMLSLTVHVSGIIGRPELHDNARPKHDYRQAMAAQRSSEEVNSDTRSANYLERTCDDILYIHRKPSGLRPLT
jgi:hypothetical protein